MAKIEGEILIGRPLAEVFDFVADPRNEPRYNPAMARVELLTPLPIGRGTRFRARMGKTGTQMLVELTEFDRPHRLGSRTTSSMMQTSGALTFAAGGDGTVMSWDWQVRPNGWMRMLGPLFGPLGGRMERRIWTSLKRYLESTAAPVVTRPTPQPGHGGSVGPRRPRAARQH
jgi:carbon monoxide dehydrogenase subunit G